MKHQALFSSKDKRQIKALSAANLLGSLKVNPLLTTKLVRPYYLDESIPSFRCFW